MVRVAYGGSGSVVCLLPLAEIHGVDQPLHGGQVLEERGPALHGELVTGVGTSADEPLHGDDVAHRLQLLQVQAERAVSDSQTALERREIKRALGLQGGQQTQSHGSMHRGVQVGEIDGWIGAHS